MASKTQIPKLQREDEISTTFPAKASQVKHDGPPGVNETPLPSSTSMQNSTHGQAVRFSSVLQEIEPAHSLQTMNTLTSDNSKSNEPLSPEAQEEIRNLSRTLQESHALHQRMSHFTFEPVSLPASRVPSKEPSPHRGSRQDVRSGGASPNPSPSMHSVHTPPLTPAVSSSRDERQGTGEAPGTGIGTANLSTAQMTPQTSNPQKESLPPTGSSSAVDSRVTTVSAGSRPSSPSEGTSTRPTTVSSGSGLAESKSKHTPLFSTGPTGDSIPPSREHSPTGTSRPGSGTTTPPTAYSRPFTPAGDRDDPYQRSRRPPQSRNLDTVEARFIFGGRDSRRHSGIGTVPALGQLPRSNSGNDLKSSDRHQSGFSLHSLAGKKDHLGHLHEGGNANSGKPHGSMSDLKRFFRIGHSGNKRSASPARSAKAAQSQSGSRTPPYQLPPTNVPFADDHGLQSKYGKFGKVLGSGAGGSVRLMKRSSDGVTFAVKQFRDRHSYESEKEYAKKVTAEFCIGSTLHHGNIIETLDIIHEKGHWYEVMEYAPYDLFAIVMTGKMSREEVACSFLQIFNGVTYLHSMGLAHRDLKLDNVVVNEYGIMKLIDFGSATVFRYPFENDIVLASGVVGSDPYLAPEVYDSPKYDPQPTDIWSLAIIYACMSLRRFPWKAPRLTDNSFKLFVSAPTPGTPTAETFRRTSEQRPKSMMDLPAAEESARRRSAPISDGNTQSRQTSLEDSASKSSHHHHHHSHRQSAVSTTEQAAGEAAQAPQSSQASHAPGPRIDAPKQDVIKGPWRLLRLLPRESRSIMGRMLEIDPKKRATLEEILEDPWVSGTPVCRQEEGGTVVRAPGHEHTLEPGTPTTPTPSRK